MVAAVPVKRGKKPRTAAAAGLSSLNGFPNLTAAWR